MCELRKANSYVALLILHELALHDQNQTQMKASVQTAVRNGAACTPRRRSMQMSWFSVIKTAMRLPFPTSSVFNVFATLPKSPAECVISLYFDK